MQHGDRSRRPKIARFDAPAKRGSSSDTPDTSPLLSLKVPEELQLSPQTDAQPANKPPSPLQLPKAAKSARPSVPDAPPSPTSNEDTQSLLSNSASVNADEEFGEDEKMLNEFVKRHPMLRRATGRPSSPRARPPRDPRATPARSMEATSVRTMQLVAGMLDKTRVKVPELPVVPKSFDDKMLSPPNKAVGERECLNGEQCLCMFMAKIRYGDRNDKGFVCKEYLLPEQHASFLAGGGLPPQQRKCLICTRYYLNYVYILARSNSKFNMEERIAVQSFQNRAACPITTASRELPEHVSTVGCRDGYLPHAMLFVDEGFAQNRVQRETGMSVFSFRPVVRFCSTHYRYCKDCDGERQIVQVGIGVDDNLNGLGFR